MSAWIEAPEDPAPALARDLRVDVAIVGAGYTGLSTAIALRNQGLDVALLEREFAGYGASGRNAGHLTPTIGKDLPTLLRVFGKERASALVRFADRAVEYTEDLIGKLGIDCDYTPCGNILASVHAGQTKRLQHAAEAGAALGARVRFATDAELRERGVPRAFQCGVLEERGGTLHPGRYVSGLRRAARDAGVRLHEGTAVREVADGPRPSVRTEGGRVTADTVVLSTNAYTPSLGRLTRAVAPVWVSLFETAPLDDGQRSRLGWRGREGIYTAHEILESYHLTARGTIVGGSKGVQYHFGSALREGADPRLLRKIDTAFRARFPELGDVAVASQWGGWIALPLDFLPLLGGTAGVLHGIGYSGHGVAQSTLMGELLAHRITGRDHPSAAALARRTWSWPPEPLRWLGSRVLTGILEAIDARTDRRVRTLAGH